MIAAIAAVRNEADIVELSMRHILAEGVDHVYVSLGPSADDTTKIVQVLADETGNVTCIIDDDPTFRQAIVMNGLAARAGNDGYEWIVPFDADEFIYAVDGDTVASALNQTQHDKLYLRMYRHHDWTRREVDHKPLPKVVYRWNPDARLAMGQHEVTIGGGTYGVLALREWQYRDYANFVAKRDLWLAQPDCGAHTLSLAGKDDAAIRAEYDAIMAIETVYDPIPSRAL